MPLRMGSAGIVFIGVMGIVCGGQIAFQHRPTDTPYCRFNSGLSFAIQVISSISQECRSDRGRPMLWRRIER